MRDEGGGVSSQYPRKRNCFTLEPMPHEHAQSWRVLVLFSAKDMPIWKASETREGQVSLARVSRAVGEEAERHMSTSST